MNTPKVLTELPSNALSRNTPFAYTFDHQLPTTYPKESALTGSRREVLIQHHLAAAGIFERVATRTVSIAESERPIRRPIIKFSPRSAARIRIGASFGRSA